jgi:hypothetical protein
MQTKDFETWKELKGFIDELRGQGEFIWRGHASAEWTLSSSVYRYFESQGVPPELREKLEEEAIAAFRDGLSNLENYESRDAKTAVDFMMMMQHYGCPTRLLDCTRSPYMAVYFSLAEIHDKGALYALNLTKYQETVAPKLPLDDYDCSLLSWVPDRIFKRFLADSDVSFPIPLHPRRLTKRAFEQQSIFLIDMSLVQPTEEALSSFPKELLWKLVFPKSLRETIHEDLVSMNVDGFHLFQGMSGLALRSKEYLFGAENFGHSIKTEPVDF